MSNSELAILISITSLVLATLALGWNIYRDVVLKARVRVRFSIRHVIQKGSDPSPPLAMLSAVNHGPTGSVRIMSIHARLTQWKIGWPLRQTSYAFVFPDCNHSLNAPLPAQLQVGHGIDHILPYGHDFLRIAGKPFTGIGFTDSFGRTHWAPRSDVEAAWAQFRSDFPQDASNPNPEGPASSSYQRSLMAAGHRPDFLESGGRTFRNSQGKRGTLS